jgi:uncharacterized protein YbaR (Trm112 family)
MHILVTDRLVCSRCGPAFGLVLVADRIESRRALAGYLGCPNCRERYPVVDGFADLRPVHLRSHNAEVAPAEREPLASDDPEEALRLGALLGVHEGPGFVLLVGPAAGHARRLAGMLPEVEMLAAHLDLRGGAEENGVTRVGVADRLPFANRSVRGAVLQGEAGRALATEALRVLVPGGRLVLLGPVEDAPEALARGGARILMKGDRAIVAAAP